MTIIIDDAGSGDLLFGVVIGAYRSEDQDFRYDVIDVQYFQQPRFSQKEYLRQASNTVFSLLGKLELKMDEPIRVCRGYIFDIAVNDLIQTYGANRISRIKVVGEPQRLTETAYLEEIGNLGYRPLREREEKRAKNFYHMMQWLKGNQEMIKYVKTGWPRLSRYLIFREIVKEKYEH
ncbi:MAG: hypothetical protein V1915_04085 [Candidatus Bathyarchaeota archaeon]